LLSRRWLAAHLAGALVVFAVAAWSAPTDPLWAHFGVALAFAMLTAVVFNAVRRNSLLRLRASLDDKSREAIERGRAEDALRASEARFRQIFENAPVMMHSIDREGCIIAVNEKWLEETGYKREEVMGRALTAVLTPESAETVVCETLPRLWREGGIRDVPVRLLHRNGSSFDVILDSAVVEGPDANAVSLTVSRNVTARRRAEAERERLRHQLFEARKLESLGLLAGGIAHDFNNLLTVIEGNAQLALMAGEEGDPHAAEFLEKVLAASERGASLVRQLRIFGRKQPMEQVAVDLNRTIGDLLHMLGRLIGEDIAIEPSLFPGLWTLRGDNTNLEQILMNLTVNARDAMPKGGRLTIETDNVLLDEAACAASPEARPGRFVRLTVSDTGVGIDEATLQHIFEPFFSTKDPGTSSGLGLSVVYGVVKQHGGWITATSEPSRGATFKVYLPAAFPEPDEAAREEKLLSGLRGSGERILLVEDEAAVRDFAHRGLRRSGYRVVSAANAGEAADVFERERGEFRLLISDVVLPGRSGVDLADDLHACAPGLQVLLTSGYTDDKVHWPDIEAKGFAFLQKPYTLIGLLRAARDALGHAN